MVPGCGTDRQMGRQVVTISEFVNISGGGGVSGKKRLGSGAGMVMWAAKGFCLGREGSRRSLGHPGSLSPQVPA